MLMSIEQVKYLFLVITEHNLRHVGIRKEKKRKNRNCRVRLENLRNQNSICESDLRRKEKLRTESGAELKHIFFGFMASLLSSKRRVSL